MIATIEHRYLTAAEKGEQDEQVWRAQRILAKRKAELAEQQTPRDMWLAKIRRAG